MSWLRGTGLAALAAAGLTLAGPSGCSDALSSLETVQRGNREVFPCQLRPDFGRRGQTLSVAVTLDARLVARLSGQPAFPTEISFGSGVSLSSFDSTGPDGMQVELLISPLAEEGERSPSLIFALDKVRVEAEGKFWVLPSLE
ncbi:MAG TPA: hypothetical protein PK668_04220 [Myxococcota bacterium]|nr:hypothetical protein [Myxococcota bacterium]HRY92065.1 hypothetical protein [Myxococcota bacterium]HSA21439.1 hypothetical protein [Myxococcota bacterium]